jgi:hypothetical protein
VRSEETSPLFEESAFARVRPRLRRKKSRPEAWKGGPFQNDRNGRQPKKRRGWLLAEARTGPTTPAERGSRKGRAGVSRP